MVFSSLEFLFWFLPIFLISYFFTPRRYKNVTLLIGSLFFYAYGEPIYILLMMFSIIINFYIAKQICATFAEETADISLVFKRKVLLIISLVIDFGILFVFKYLNFFISIVNGIAHKHVFSAVDITLPLGISFYTFQIVSYVIDAYRHRDDIYEKDNILNFATYVCMFPQLIAGPIVNYKEVAHSLKSRRTRYINIDRGLTTFIMGLSYKVLLANNISSLWNDVWRVGPYGVNTPTAWLAAIGYTMQIYFDFFGYSLMAIGLGRILGFRIPKNFHNPYCAKSATDFWRRWHITLGRWFREYLYIPLGGNRKGKYRTILNLFVVWAFTGLWHGANWNFVLWGLFFFVILMIEKFYIKDKLESSKYLGRIYIAILIPISWTIFNITDLKLLIAYIGRMLFIPLKGSVIVNGMSMFMDLLGTYWWLLGICLICSTPYPMKYVKKYRDNIFVKLLMIALFWVCVWQIATGANNPFLYFRF